MILSAPAKNKWLCNNPILPIWQYCNHFLFIYDKTLVLYVALLCPNHHLLNMKLMHKCVSYFWWCTKLSNKLKEKYIDNQIMIYVKRKKEWFCKTNIEQRPLINYYPWKLQLQFSDGYLSYSNHNAREWIKMHSF